MSDGIPDINPTIFYSTSEAATLTGESAANLNSMRFRKQGPKYRQRKPGARVAYLGLWLIEYLRESIREPVA